MHRIDDLDREVDRNGPGKDGFTEGDPSPPEITPTLPTADWFNDVQETLASAVEGADVSLVKLSFGQLLDAIARLIGAMSLRNWFVRSAGGYTGNFQAVRWCAQLGLWVAVGASGRIMTSPDGLTWTAQTSGTTETIHAIGFDGTTIVVCGSTGLILTSTDGVTWTSRTSGTVASLLSIAANGGTWVIVGQGGVILTATTVSTWATRTSGTGSDLLRVIYSTTASLFIATGATGVIDTSPTGTTWTIRTSGVIGDIVDIVDSGTRLVGIVAGSYVTSTNGTTWATGTISGPATFRALGIENALFVAVGDSGAIFTSPDGTTWTSRSSGTTAHLYTVRGTGRGIVVAGASCTVSSSPGAKTWRASRPVVNASASAWRAIGANDTTCVAVGDGGLLAQSAAA